MGLLSDMFNSEDGRIGLGLLAAGGPTTDPNQSGLGARLQNAVGSVDQWKKQQAQAAQAKQQMEMMQQYKQAQMAELQAHADQRQAMADQRDQDAAYSKVMNDGQADLTARVARGDLNGVNGQLDTNLLVNAMLQNPAYQKYAIEFLGKRDAASSKPEKQSPVAQLISERDALPLGHPSRTVYDAAIKKATTHQPVPLGAPVAGVDENGQPIFVQPNRSGGAPVVLDGVTPAPKVNASQNKANINNNVALDKLDNALSLVQSNPDAFGLKNILGDTITQRTDPKGVLARAAVSDIAGLKIHDRSGAAVPAAEMARLTPYVPSVNDTTPTIIKKLGLFKREYQRIQSEYAGSAHDTPESTGKTVVKTGRMGGRKVVQYSDGTTDYAD